MSTHGSSLSAPHLMVLLLACMYWSDSSADGPCATQQQGKTALQSAADGLDARQWCEFATPSLTYSLIEDFTNPSGSALGYAGKGVYDRFRRKVRYLGGPHGKGDMRLIEYDEVTDNWYNESKPSAVGEGHGYDHNLVDPKTGFHYIRKYHSNQFYYWNGASWNSIADDDKCAIDRSEPAIGMDWDESRNGIVHASDGGVCFWSKAENSWTYDGDSNFIGRYHFAAAYNPKHQVMWLQDYNGVRHASNRGGNIEQLSSRPPAGIDTLGCCGSGGVMTVYDHASELFIVTNHRTGAWAEYDIGNDSWRTFSNSLASELNPSVSSVSTFYTAIAPHGVIMYVAKKGSGSPKAYIYKHADGAITIPPATRSNPPTELTAE